MTFRHSVNSKSKFPVHKNWGIGLWVPGVKGSVKYSDRSRTHYLPERAASPLRAVRSTLIMVKATWKTVTRHTLAQMK